MFGSFPQVYLGETVASRGKNKLKNLTTMKPHEEMPVRLKSVHLLCIQKVDGCSPGWNGLIRGFVGGTR